jgi:restriction system protein
MALWLCRAGRFGERENDALEQSRAVIGWEEVSDLKGVESRDEMLTSLRATYPSSGERTLVNWRNQLWAFSKTMARGDLVVLPLKQRPAIAFGRIVGNYSFDSLEGPIRHFRNVEWIVRDIPRTKFPKDLLFSFGAAQTVCQITRHDAEGRINNFLKTGAATEWSDSPKTREALIEDETSDLSDPSVIDIQDYADDQVRRFIQSHFAGHDLARLVEGILLAKGYKTLNSKPGRDGGVDILAGLGELGFDAPRICVQVKSEDSPLDVSVLRELQATI